MAINTFTFGGVTSSDFGIYVSGEGLFNAPKRAAEVVSIPGRNGDFILDQGKFENIKVTYRVFNQEKDLADFRTKLADLRSALASQVGYQRLEDTFHPSEYRMAAFIEGVEIEPIKYNTASEFEITFECKPQRFLKSGETAVSVTSGDTLTNPTLFNAPPLLEVEGYGKIGFNGFEVNVENADFGIVDIAKSVTYPDIHTILIELNDDLYNVGDTITVDNLQNPWPFQFTYQGGNYIVPIDGELIDQLEVDVTPTWRKRNGAFECLAQAQFVAGTSSSGFAQAEYNIPKDGSIGTITVTFTFDYAAPFNTIEIWASFGKQVSDNRYSCDLFNSNLITPSAVADSTLTYLGHPTYIDCEIGEAYQITGGQVVPLNKYIDLGSELPTLASGGNEVTFDNTVTDLQIVPRWWKV